MEIRAVMLRIKILCIVIITGSLMSLQQLCAQVYTIKEGKMYIEINKNITRAALDSFLTNYNLTDIGIKDLIQHNSADSLKLMGWVITKNNVNTVAITKSLVSADDLTNLAEKVIFAQKNQNFSALFPSTNNGLVFGYNKFKNKTPFLSIDSIVTFYLRNRTEARAVMLAGSFSNWQQDAIPMTRTDTGWVAKVKLGPGKYWYKFIVDNNWIIDDDNLQRENDGQGNINSAFYKTNHSFKLNGYKSAKKVYVAGSFNNWRPNELQLWRTADGWQLPIYLADGTYTYKFIVDGDWKTDPENPEKFPNEFDDHNSVIRFGRPYVFRLAGYDDAKKVVLTGSFNNWRKDELYMKKTTGGWELPYTLGGGNYEYRFVVDGKEMKDPANPVATQEGLKGNSFLILEPNYTFRLKGHANAQKVYLAGDFNNFSPNSLAMKRSGDEWLFTIHLSRGKHLYKFIVDGKWIKDPDNKLWEQNQYQTGDSVIWVEK